MDAKKEEGVRAPGDGRNVAQIPWAADTAAGRVLSSFSVGVGMVGIQPKHTLVFQLLWKVR